jgi:hypothetical protein
MGLLDDAIREHLDLKRRRGGDPVEIERAEQEALGPVRRAPEGSEPQPLDEPVPAEHELDYGQEAEPELEGSYATAETEAEPLAPEPAEEPPGPHVHDEAEPAASFVHDEAEPSAPQVPDEAEPPAPQVHDEAERPAAEHGGQETAEYDVKQELEQHDDDVLEETPEFLQDTPEHDRLWFEQRPPRDFDFEN